MPTVTQHMVALGALVRIRAAIASRIDIGAHVALLTTQPAALAVLVAQLI